MIIVVSQGSQDIFVQVFSCIDHEVQTGSQSLWIVASLELYTIYKQGIVSFTVCI